MRNKTRKDSRRGITTIELGLLLPLIFVLVMGVIETGTMYYSWVTVQKAAQSGARVASTGMGEEEGTRLTQIETETQRWLIGLGHGSTDVEVSSWASPSDALSGDGVIGSAGDPCGMVQVSVVYHYHPFTPLVGSIFPTVITISGKDRKLNEPWKPCDS